MKRVTFVFLGILVITASVLLTQNKTHQQESASIVKADLKKNKLPEVFD
ncbi:hypothetical protein [Lacinutrix sp. Hel_I_90]|nr:hypothetical protein [Lacinutrix sp. Hel_I_90]